ncbi:MAG: ABC-F family ATP-binding cassette domain-containing protein [Bacteroidia bacterium]|nr:ABC-F family ATP-binding cassette domain-containing protein [Bacteroidia bacterium]
MIHINDIVFEFGARKIFDDASWHIKPNSKIGLIGQNGTGKSTLLRIIDGQFKISSGSINMRKDLQIGFLNQDLLSFSSDSDILTVAMQAFERVNELKEKEHRILEEMEKREANEKTLNDLHNIQVEIQALDGYNIEQVSAEILEGLGFSTTDLSRSYNEFSGGWRMRVILSKILLQKPDILLLDEPTNHLDLPSIKWIEEYLRNYSGTVVIVSHDRYFLDNVVNEIAEISFGQITTYAGNYSKYLEEKQIRDEHQQNRFENQEKYIKEQEKFINRFRAKATKARAVQSRIKALEKMQKIESVEDNRPEIKINFEFDLKPGKVVADLKVKKKNYGELSVFDSFDIDISAGDKIAIVGANGIGKSTMLRMITGLEPFDGELNKGYNVVPAFYAQHQLESLNLKNDVLQELSEVSPDYSENVLRKILGAFLFFGDDVFKKIKVLSGGEKSRVALAKTMLQRANFMLLDEPTNHLDIPSIERLIDVLNDYTGTYIIVSHDRHFLSKVTNKIWYLENKKLICYPGTYNEYEDWAKRRTKTTKTNKAKEKPKSVDKPNEQRQSKEERKLKKRVQNQLSKTETRVQELERKKDDLTLEMSKPENARDVGKLNELNDKFNIVEKELALENKKWEELFEKLSEFDESI